MEARMVKTALSLFALVLLAGCFPANHTYTGGPWEGCVTSMDGGAIDCDYPSMEWGGPTPSSPAAHPPLVVPGSPVTPYKPPVATPPRPLPTPHPMPPIKPPSGPPDGLDEDHDDGEDKDEDEDDCKPGHGYGDSRCHSGPPGRR